MEGQRQGNVLLGSCASSGLPGQALNQFTYVTDFGDLERGI